MTVNGNSWRRKLLYSLIVCSIALAIVELLSRFVLPFPLGTQRTYISDPNVLYFHRPGSSGYEVAPHGDFSPTLVQYNELGFRGKLARNPDRPIVVMLGDSFVEARQVDEKATFTGLLGKQYKEYEFINAGCSAYTTTTEYLLLKNRVIGLRPSKVILFFSFNDYADNFNYQGGYFRHPEVFTDKVPPRELIPLISDRPAGTAMEFLKANSAIMANMARWLGAKPLMQLAVPSDRNRFQHSFKAVNTATDSLDTDGRMVLEFTHRGLAEIAALTKREGIDFSVFIIPLPTQVSSQQWSPGKTGYYGYRPDESDDSVTYQSRLLGFCKSADIACLDLLPDFRAAASSGTSLFLPYDGHWTEEGHRLVASAVARHLDARPVTLSGPVVRR